MSPQWDPPAPEALSSSRNGALLASEEPVTWRVTRADVTKPRNPAFSPAVNIQFFEPLLKCHAHKPLIMASACLWTPSKLSMSFLCLDPDLAQSGFQMELNLNCAGRAWSVSARGIKSWHIQPRTPLPFFNPRAYGQLQAFAGAMAFHVRSTRACAPSIFTS